MTLKCVYCSAPGAAMCDTCHRDLKDEMEIARIARRNETGHRMTHGEIANSEIFRMAEAAVRANVKQRELAKASSPSA